jgi:transposase
VPAHHKTLEDASIRLGSVAADVLGVSGRAMLAALLAGERDPKVLAGLARGRLRNKLPELREALRGRFSVHHALLVRLALEHVEQLERSISELDAAVDRVIAPFALARDRLDTITGVAKRAAETIIAEIGVDISVFPTAGHLASWAGRCPGNNVTGGKRRSGKPTKGNRWLGEVLTECAWAAARSRDSYLSAQFWRLARRIGKQEGGHGRGPLHLGHRLAPAHQRLRLRRPGWRLLRPPRHRPRPQNAPWPNSRSSATRSPSNPSPPDGRFSFQDEAGGSSPARPTTPALSWGNARWSPSSAVASARHLPHSGD